MSLALDTRRSRVAGSLYGLLLGDALGLPVETMSAAQISSKLGRVERMLPARGRRPGMHSDDGQQALTLCEALLLGGAHPEGFLARLWVEMAQADGGRPGLFGLHRWTGKNFRATVQALRRGAEPAQAATTSAGNGVAMMIAPLAWWRPGDMDWLREMTLRIGGIKQKDPRGLGSAAAVVFLTSHAVLHGDFSSLDEGACVAFVESIEEETCARGDASLREFRRLFSRALGEMFANRHQPRGVVLDKIAAEASRSMSRPCGPGAGYALGSVITAIYLALSGRGFAETLSEAVSLGEDADSTGAMCGALLGACVGREGLPPAWCADLAAFGALDDRVEALATHEPFSPQTSLVELERAWTRLAFSPLA